MDTILSLVEIAEKCLAEIPPDETLECEKNIQDAYDAIIAARAALMVLIKKGELTRSDDGRIR